MNVIAVLFKYSRNFQLRLLKHVQASQILQKYCTTATTNIGEFKKNEQTDEQYDENIKKQILGASLPFVNEYGWTKETLVKGAESLGYPGITHGLFEQSGAELVHYFYADCNQKLAAKLKQNSEETPIVPEKFLNYAIETRLQMIVPYKSRWPQAIAIMSLPPNVRHTLENLKTLADDICYYAGDRSVDFMWYARRFAVAGLYKTTELYMMQDNSENHQKTWDFLNRRVEEVFQINGLLTQTENMGNKSPEFLSSAFTTVRNILRG